eukprot:CAMPEP_0194076630 /NCGR_PEP_ID=MMETSP0149-20130528/3408_1 /TAXON_ID=122233 /ORGANISM="Chaetoceros debilis, Strain MM31A-1" /LENGTH=122 /DNA_ID=CAMNT_0038757429 /DNA_START=55 /DNA_END=421 /DNA_ORIENTATION=+
MNPYIQTSSALLFIACIHYHTIGFLITIVCRGNSMKEPAPLTAAPLTASVGILATERLEMDRNDVDDDDDDDDDDDGANPDTDAGGSESRSAVSAVLKIMIELLLDDMLDVLYCKLDDELYW